MTTLTDHEARCVARMALLVPGPESRQAERVTEAVVRATSAFCDPLAAGLTYAPHVDGGRDLVSGVTLPLYREPARAVRLAAALKAADPEALVTVVVWADDGEPCHDDATDKRGGGG